MIREIITIDEERCDGCGACVPACPEGALQVVDGKARVVGELLCDGLGACIGRCPQGAITIERREAEPYDETRVIRNLASQGGTVVLAHLGHLLHNGQEEAYRGAVRYIADNEFTDRDMVLGRLAELEEAFSEQCEGPAGCPGSQSRTFGPARTAAGRDAGRTSSAPEAAGGAAQPSELTHWPIQMHLINPAAPYFRGSDLLLAADCTAFSLGGFHSDLLKGRTLTIACPKLDQGLETYLEKLVLLIDQARINTLTVAVMEVPCCGGLVRLAAAAAERAGRKVPIKRIVVAADGRILDEAWL